MTLASVIYKWKVEPIHLGGVIAMVPLCVGFPFAWHFLAIGFTLKLLLVAVAVAATVPFTLYCVKMTEKTQSSDSYRRRID